MTGSWRKFGLQAVDIRDEFGSVNESSRSSVTPQWVVECPQLFSGTIQGREGNTTPCLWIKVGAYRDTSYDTSGELYGDGAVVSDNVVVAMRYGSWGPFIQDFMYNGKNIPKISLVRFSHIEGTQIEVQRIDYFVCKICQYVQKDDIITWSFNFVKVIDTNIAYNNDGSKIGNAAVEYNSDSLLVKGP